MERIGPLNYGSLWERWARGVKWTWINDDYRARLPEDVIVSVMDLQCRDRLHAKQGRSTARVVLHKTDRPLAVYLKRHYKLPWPSRLAALIDPSGRHSPASAEWTHLERVRALGIPVPEVVAAGERIGPGTDLTSFLMVAELTDCEPLNESLPQLADRLEAKAFERLKRIVIEELARMTANLHAASVFHKDLYLCHFFLDPDQVETAGQASRIVLIDLHRLAEHRLWPDWWRWKDLGQLLYSTAGVAGITNRDRLRFWKCYRRLVGIKRSRWQARMIRLRAARYLAHNRKAR
jgi:heptose I phosphotransferase